MSTEDRVEAESDNSQEVSSQDNFSFVAAEHQVLDYWQKHAIFQQTLDKTKECQPYIFYDGPPFATGLPHYGHLLASTLKDIIPRYFTMNGFHVERRWGWDCHGLPIEHEIDKAHDMPAHEAVEKLGIAAYNAECRSIVQRYSEEWEKTIHRLGRWVSFEEGYKTMDLAFMNTVWGVFRKLWDKGLVYQGTKVMPVSTELGTVLSNFEATSNYQEVQDPAITVLFKLKAEDKYIAAWTTTPWTLPSNLGLCVGPEIEYVLVKDEKGRQIYFAKERLAAYFPKDNLPEPIETKQGKDLVGIRYEPLFPYFQTYIDEGAFTVFMDDYVSTADGTGIVHTAPGFGEDDARVMQAAGVKVVACPVNEHGIFSEEVTLFAGLHVKAADKPIIKHLKAEDKLFKQDVCVHSYPFCPRSDTPLIYKAIPSWYINVEKIKADVLAANQEIYWIPEHIKEGRFGRWLENAKDWAVSRNRVWGTPLPIWINDESGKPYCVGSKEELAKLTQTQIEDLHREHVDHLTFTLTNESGTYRRIPEVLDCWFESGSMPYAQFGLDVTNMDEAPSAFPAQFIAEGLDQTRGWFYTLTVLSAALFNKPAFKNVIVNGIILASDGKKMSKRLKNYTAPELLMEKYGSDAIRLYFMNSGLVKAEELCFQDDGVKDMVRRVLLPWHNACKFFDTYAEIDGWQADQHFCTGGNPLDKWLLSRLNTLVKNVTVEMQAYKLYNVIPVLFSFIEDLTNWYIRLNRRRFWADGLELDKQSAYTALFSAVKTVTLLMAPFAPFLAETIYQTLRKYGGCDYISCHLEDYPKYQEDASDLVLEDSVDRLYQVILLGRQLRNEKKIKVKIPLPNLTIVHKDEAVLQELQKLESILKLELNLKQVSYSQAEDQYINLFARPNSPVLGKRLGKQFKMIMQAVRNLDGTALQAYEVDQKMTLEGVALSGDDIFVYREAKAGMDVLSNRLISIEMDCTLTEDLVDEGLAREVVNRIQKTRKQLDFNVADRIKTGYHATPVLQRAIEKHLAYIQSETLCIEMNKSDKVNMNENTIEYQIDDEQLTLSIVRVEQTEKMN